jgi:phosphatidylglycerophosphate synthase
VEQRASSEVLTSPAPAARAAGTAVPPPLTRHSSLGEVLDRTRTAGKSSSRSPAYSRFVNRRLGRYLAALAFKAGRTPDQVTAASACASVAGITVLATRSPSAVTGVLVAALLVLGYALDSADGQLARLRGGGSLRGEWLDHVVDCVKVTALHLAVLVSFYRFADERSLRLLLPLAYTVVAVTYFFAFVLTDLLRRTRPVVREPEPQGAASLRRSLLALPTDFGLLCLVFLLLGSPTGFLAGYLVLFAVNTAFLAAALQKWFRDLGRAAAPDPRTGGLPR